MLQHWLRLISLSTAIHQLNAGQPLQSLAMPLLHILALSVWSKCIPCRSPFELVCSPKDLVLVLGAVCMHEAIPVRGWWWQPGNYGRSSWTTTAPPTSGPWSSWTTTTYLYHHRQPPSSGPRSSWSTTYLQTMKIMNNCRTMIIINRKPDQSSLWTTTIMVTIITIFVAIVVFCHNDSDEIVSTRTSPLRSWKRELLPFGL